CSSSMTSRVGMNASRSEIPNSKAETNPKSEISIAKPAGSRLAFLDLAIRDCFGFRAWDFGFRGQRDRKTGPALGPVVSLETPAVLFHDAARDAQAQAGARRLGAGKGCEQPAEHFRGNATPCIADDQAHGPVRSDVERRIHPAAAGQG